MTNNFSILEQKFDEQERRLIEEAAFGKGLKSLPEDWDRTREKRLVKSAERSFAGFAYFATTYFPAWFEFPFSRGHRTLLKSFLANDRKIHVYAMERDFGKTRIFRVIKVWCACHGVKRHYSKASDTLDLVEKDFRYVRDIIKYNPKIVSDFGHIVDDNWDSLHSFRIVPHKHNPLGTIFVANSATVTPRGELGETRVDFEEFDEFEDYSTSINPDISRQKLDVIERDFHPALTDHGCGVYLGNNARTTCLINILVEEATDSSGNRKPQLARPAFSLTVIDAWDERNNRPNWHERYKFTSEEKMRESLSVSIGVWLAEYRQRPSPPEGVRFLREHWLTFNSVPRDAKGIFFCDPAFGETSDFKTFALMLYSPSLKKFLVPECFVRRCGWEEYYLAMYDTYERWRLQLYWIGWEGNFAQAQYLEFRKIYISTAKKPDLPIRIINVEGDKFFRIEQIETPFSLGNILFAENFLNTRDGVEAQSQLIGYVGKKTAKHRVDFPDAMASAYREMWPIAMEMTSETGNQRIVTGGRRKSADRW